MSTRPTASKPKAVPDYPPTPGDDIDPPHPGGRPRELDRLWAGNKGSERKTKRQALLEVLSSGAPIRLACDYAGISVETLYAERDRDGEFAEQLARVRATAQVLTLQELRGAGMQPMRAPGFLRRDAKALRDWLALTNPDDFGERLNIRAEHRVEIVQVVMTAIQESVELVIQDPETRLRLAAAVGDRLAASLGGTDPTAIPLLPRGQAG